MKIEEYIQKNKLAFDNKEPDLTSMWSQINLHKGNKKVKKLKIVKWMAASILLALAIGFLVRHELVLQQQITSLSQISRELAQKEDNLNALVNQKWSEYKQIEGNGSPIELMLMNELKQLDTLYQKGLNDIKIQGYNERAVIIMLETYEKRLRIIEKLIYEKEKQIRYESRKRQVDI